MTNSDTHVSIITPVYNGEAFISECIESIIAQTHSSWDYTIVNNCSTDKTLDIIKKYESQDNRIRVITNKEFVGVIENHNIAFRSISSESKYCKVVSADDWIYPDCLSQLIRVGNANPSAGIIGSYQISGSTNIWRNWSVKCDGIPYPSTTISGKEACRQHFLGGPYVFGNPTSVLYRADLIRGVDNFFPNSRPGADTSACYKYLQISDFGFVHQVLSYERIHESAITTQCRSVNSFLPALLQDFVDYGKYYFSEEEFNTRLEVLLAEYYTFLADNILQFRDKDFWAFHTNNLVACGFPLSKRKFLISASSKAIDVLLNPKRTLEKILFRFGKEN